MLNGWGCDVFNDMLNGWGRDILNGWGRDMLTGWGVTCSTVFGFEGWSSLGESSVAGPQGLFGFRS